MLVEYVELQNVATGEKLPLGMVITPDYVLSYINWGTVESTHHSYKYVNQVGEYVTGTTLETRDVEIVGWVIARNADEMKNKKKFLNRFVNPQQAIDVFYEEYTLRFLPDSSIKYSKSSSENNEILCKFTINGFCPDPMFAKKTESQVTAANTAARFRFPLIISRDLQEKGIVFGVRQPSLIVNVENDGAVSIGMRIVIKAKGTVVNPQIINVETQKFFKVNKTMQAGEEIEIDTIIGEKSVIGRKNGVEENYFKYRDLDSEWLQLEVGGNLFRYDAQEKVENLEVFMYYNNKFLEVQ